MYIRIHVGGPSLCSVGIRIGSSRIVEDCMHENPVWIGNGSIGDAFVQNGRWLPMRSTVVQYNSDAIGKKTQQIEKFLKEMRSRCGPSNSRALSDFVFTAKS